MIVAMYMTEDVATVGPRVDGQELIELLTRRRLRRVPVVDGDRLVGIVSKSDVARALPAGVNAFSAEARAGTRAGFRVEQIMTRTVRSVAHDAPVEEAARILADEGLGVLPVLRDGALVGILSQTDLVRAFREIVFRRDATRLTLEVPPSVSLLGPTALVCERAGLELTGYAEHVRGGHRYALLSVAGGDTAPVVESLWQLGARVLHVKHPVPASKPAPARR